MSDSSQSRPDKLLQLSEDVSRIAASLAQLSMAPSQLDVGKTSRDPASEPVNVATVRSVIRARRLRANYFEDYLFADPAWDMLLHLFEGELAQFRVPISSLCAAAAVPATTGLRWLKRMTDAGILVRRADPSDARRVYIELSPAASAAMSGFFKSAELADVA